MEPIMTQPARFLIIDGYSFESRQALENAGMQLAWRLYANMLKRYRPQAEYDVWLPSDPGNDPPVDKQLAGYQGIIWTGCNLCINDTDNPSIANQIELAKRVYEIGVPSWGSCWGLQMAAVAAGGKVIANPKGREMGLARKVGLTEAGQAHPMFAGKPKVFDAFISHEDMVSVVPPGGTVLAGNEFTTVQALVVTHQKGTFWSTQYHPEYDLGEMAALIVAREEKLIRGGFFRTPTELQHLVSQMRMLQAEPDRKDLRWQLAIDDDVMDDGVRQCEFANWIDIMIKPGPEPV
jgi:GMP synthase (glutamine-hydrolysing)